MFKIRKLLSDHGWFAIGLITFVVGILAGVSVKGTNLLEQSLGRIDRPAMAGSAPHHNVETAEYSPLKPVWRR